MRIDGRLARMQHVLMHMAAHDGRATSERIAGMLDTNPVVVRRTMGRLRERGIVQSERGRSGGWVLARSLEGITVLDIYRALGDPSIFAIGPSIDHPECRFEAIVNAELGTALRTAEAQIIERFGQLTLADLARRAATDARVG